MIGKLIDLKQTSIQASRYAAWESTVTDHNRGAPDNVQSRFFGDASATISTTPRSVENNNLWGSEDETDRVAATLPVTMERTEPAAAGDFGENPIADTRVAIDESTAAAVAYESAYSTPAPDGTAVGEGTAHAFGKVVDELGSLIDSEVGGKWDVEPDGLLRGAVHVDIEGNGWYSPMTLDESSVIMTDGWSAADDGNAGKRCAQLRAGRCAEQGWCGRHDCHPRPAPRLQGAH